MIKKRWLTGLMTHQYKKLPVTMKMCMHFNIRHALENGHHSVWMQFNVMFRTIRCGKNSFGWVTGSLNGQNCFGEHPVLDIFLWFPRSQNVIKCMQSTSIYIQLNFSITCACKMDMFRQQVLLTFFHGTGGGANSLVDAASFIPLKLLFKVKKKLILKFI